MIQAGVLVLVYLPTEDMIADPLTKPKHSPSDDDELIRLLNTDVIDETD